MQFLYRFLSELKQRHDCDFTDRLNSYYTPILLGFFALTLSAKQYAGQPIQCWVPAQFIGAWEQYSEYYCFVKNTYFVPFTEDLPDEHESRKEREIGYYQWVPFILAIQAMLFFVPIAIWRFLNWQSGIWVKNVLNTASLVDALDDEKRSKNARALALYIELTTRIQKDLPTNRLRRFSPFGAHYGSYVSSVYLFIKFLFLINVVVQLWIMNQYLGTRSTFWGVGILHDIMSGKQWEETGHFPRVTMCDFKVRVLGNLHNWSIQCVLMINMFNEKIYIFLWWWFLMVTVLTIINITYWISISVRREKRRAYVRRYLTVCIGEKADRQKGIDEGPKNEEQFVDAKVRPDVALLLRLITANNGDLVTTDVVGALWDIFLEQKESAKISDNSSTSSKQSNELKVPLISKGASPRDVAEIDESQI